LFFFLEFIWKTLPEWFIQDQWQESNYWLWIPIASLTLCLLVGLTVVYMGEPGDLPYTISRVHHHAYIPIDHVMPMVFASMFSILAGGSLGPEAPLVAICGSIGGFVSRRIFRQKYVNVVRKHTLMGMAGALAAFFGVPLGGSLFALEVCSRFGVEYFEHLIESIFCGEICLVVFRSLSGLAIAPIWDLTAESGRMFEIQPWLVLAGGLIGLVGAFMAYVFASFHTTVMRVFSSLNLLDNSRAVYRGLLGGIFVVLVGILVPQTMFWGEEEFQVVATMGPTKDLPFLWPATGLTGFKMDSPWKAFIVGMTKLVAISFTVAGGLRGGYIFPLMCSGAAFGRVIHAFLPDAIPLQVCVLCMAAGMNVAITRTALASTLILAFLPGEPAAIPPILMASLCSLFATAYLVRSRKTVSTAFKISSTFTYAFLLFSHSSRVKSHEVILTIVFSTRSTSLEERTVNCQTMKIRLFSNI
jgi:H+/Cl- antiporter ClcA